MRPRWIALATSLLALAAGGGAASTGANAAPRACGTSGYAYAGVAATSRAYGVAARLTTLTAPSVRSGHVAGWVGVGGAGAGPSGSDEWIQAGFSAFPGSSASSLYYEVARPNQAPVYHELAANLEPGTSKKVAVVEVAGRPGWWQIRVDGRPMTAPVELPGSHGAWRPVATGETWGGGAFVCNGFRYRFDALAVATQPGRAWLPLRRVSTFQDHGYRVTRSNNAYVAAGG